MRSLLITIIIALLLIPGIASGKSASEEHEEFLKNLPVKGMVTLVDVGRKNCPMCKMMAPILDKLEKKYEGKAAIVFINIQEDPEQQYRFNIKALPTQIFFNPEGEEVFRHTGFMAEKAIVEQLAKMGVE